MSRRALIIGIDNYLHILGLNCCVADAKSMQQLVQRNQDGTPNYDSKLLLASRDLGTTVSRAQFREACQKLFDFTGEVLLYFSGHGALTTTGGYLATSDAIQNDVGVPMQEVMQLAYQSRASDVLVILDCCHSGDLGNPPALNVGGSGDPLALLRENMTIIAAARDTQSAIEASGHGLFTEVLLDALDGGAADHMGWVTGSGLYSYVERHFSAWGQRPVYKSHVTGVAIARKCAPLIERIKLIELVNIFPDPHHQLQLDPEFEPEDQDGTIIGPVNEKKLAIAKLLKEFRDVGLLKPTVSGEQLYWTARKSHSVELTPRGREYWRLVKFNRI
jgi:hypothetical protein